MPALKGVKGGFYGVLLMGGMCTLNASDQTLYLCPTLSSHPFSSGVSFSIPFSIPFSLFAVSLHLGIDERSHLHKVPSCTWDCCISSEISCLCVILTKAERLKSLYSWTVPFDKDFSEHPPELTELFTARNEVSVGG